MSEGRDGEHVLVVDDDELVRGVLARIAAAAGFSCDEAGSVAEARARLEAAEPQLVLLDVHLPGESGLTLAREIAGRHAGPAVIMVSGADDPEVARIALDTGAYGYLTKPFKRNEVSIALANAMRRRRLEIENRAHRARLEDRVVERSAAASDALARLRVAHEETVLRLSKAVEYRDPETGSHIERMSHYCAMLAARLALDPEVVQVASRLHDVGKIAVADSILLKPGALTPEERTEMERHAEVGYQLLQGSRSEVLDVAALIAWTHHERFDGAGYPRRLRGEDIPLLGRIAAVADVFDALTSNRVYRAALPLDEAVSMLAAERGRHFDPAVVDAFLADMDEVQRIIARFGGEGSAHPAADAAAPAAVVTLQEAAAAAGVSPSTMRRWADDGRIPSVRTAGGHRRFPLQAVRQFAAEQGSRMALQPVSPPAQPVAALAERLAADGAADLVARAGRSLYHGASPGWFAADEARAAIGEWTDALALGCETGRYAPVLEASDVLMRRAYLQAATLLERHAFVERFRDAAVRALSKHGAAQEDLAEARRLFAAIQQSLLARYS
jgi:putative two-component system response regulator